MTKLIKIIGITLIVLIVGLLIGSCILKEAFGPKYRTVHINLDDKRILVGNEIYTADFAAVFYDVNFMLEIKDIGNYKLGRGTFSDENWDKNIHIYNIADWIVLPVEDNSYLKILLTNKVNQENIDTILSPQNLRYDKLWKEKYDDIPAWVYNGSSKLDSIDGRIFFVTYEYRVGDYPPFQFYIQTIEHCLDTLSGNFKTINVFERKEIKN